MCVCPTYWSSDTHGLFFFIWSQRSLAESRGCRGNNRNPKKKTWAQERERERERDSLTGEIYCSCISNPHCQLIYQFIHWQTDFDWFSNGLFFTTISPKIMLHGRHASTHSCRFCFIWEYKHSGWVIRLLYSLLIRYHFTFSTMGKGTYLALLLGVKHYTELQNLFTAVGSKIQNDDSKWCRLIHHSCNYRLAYSAKV